MFALSWCEALCEWLGFCQRRSPCVLFVGLEGSGITTLLSQLIEEFQSVSSPREFQRILVHNRIFNCIDVNNLGLRMTKQLRNQLQMPDGIIFVIDTADQNRFNASKRELDNLLAVPDLKGVPIAVLGNKSDKAGAAARDEIASYFELPSHRKILANPSSKRIELFMTSSVTKSGYQEGIRWLNTQID